jgi:hypothetical protein
MSDRKLESDDSRKDGNLIIGENDDDYGRATATSFN